MPYYGDQKREYDRKRAASARAAWITSKGGVCVKCGSDDRIEIDHIDPSLKKYRIAGIWSRTPAVREAELANCQLLCYDCHKEKTLAERRKEYEHGTLGMYKSRNCRCPKCRAANAERCRIQRAARKQK